MKTLFDLGIVGDSKAREILEKDLCSIGMCTQKAWEDYEYLIQIAPEQCLNFTATTRANILQNNMAKHAQRLFGETEDVICYHNDGIFTIDFYGKIRLRFKKLDNGLKPSNIATGQQQEFLAQTLFGPSSTKVTAGYRLDRDGVGIRDMHIVCWYNERLLWNIPLDEYVGALGESVIEESPSGSGTRTVPRKKRDGDIAERAEGA